MSYENPHVRKAIELCENSQSELARRCGGKVRQGHVWKWLHAEKLTAEASIQIETATDGAVTRYDLRPDVFGQAPERSEAA